MQYKPLLQEPVRFQGVVFAIFPTVRALEGVLTEIGFS
jgi:hypothetical protein